jgi:hypothetical protein
MRGVRIQALVVLAACGSSGEPVSHPAHPADHGPPLTAAQLAGDLGVLRTVFEEAHAGLHRYRSKAEIDAVFDTAAKSIDHPMSTLEFFGVVTSVLAQIEDGHTTAFLPKPERTFLAEQAPVFPLDIRILGDHAYVTGTTSDVIARGCELASIDDTPFATIAKTIVPHISRDGTNQTRAVHALEEKFSYYYYLYVAQPAEFHVRCTDGAAATVAALPDPEAAKQRAQRGETPVPQPPPLAFELLPQPDVARLTISTFGDPSFEGSGFRNQLDAAFGQVAAHGVTDLIIDLRGNDGGDALGPELFARFATAPFPWVDHVDVASASLEQTHRYTHLDAAFDARFAAAVAKGSDGKLHVTTSAEPLLGVRQPSAQPFTGRVWILIDGETFSATAMFVDIVRSEQRATFVGEESGGAYGGNSANEFVAITLPATQIKVVVPLEAYFMAVHGAEAKDRGVSPDIRVEPTIADVLAGRDPVLAATLAAIAKRR